MVVRALRRIGSITSQANDGKKKYFPSPFILFSMSVQRKTCNTYLLLSQFLTHL